MNEVFQTGFGFCPFFFVDMKFGHEQYQLYEKNNVFVHFIVFKTDKNVLFLQSDRLSRYSSYEVLNVHPEYFRVCTFINGTQTGVLHAAACLPCLRTGSERERESAASALPLKTPRGPKTLPVTFTPTLKGHRPGDKSDPGPKYYFSYLILSMGHL